MNPLVSIITPSNNSANFLAETIDSILAQAYSKFKSIEELKYPYFIILKYWYNRKRLHSTL